jgi:hypothetical protein
MKSLFKVVGAVFALGAVILLGLHIFLQFGLTKTMRGVVLPQVKERVGIDVSVGRLSLNVPNGLLYLSEVKVRNPEGFLLENLASIDRVEVAVDIPSLLTKKLIRVKKIEVENGVLNVIRNKVGELNLDRLLAGVPKPTEEPVAGEPSGETGEEPVPGEPKPLPELLIEALECNAQLRYLDFKLDELDLVLAVGLSGSGISTVQAPDTPWGDLEVSGSLGDDRTRFVTALHLHLAPLTDPLLPSFDLTGRIMEIDPRIMEEIYAKLRIGSAPFGLEPDVHCRAGAFEDSRLTLSLQDIQMHQKLSKDLGGIGSIGTLKFSVPVEGSLREPKVDVTSALLGAVGDNTGTLLSAFLKGAAAKEAGLDESPESLAEAAVELLGKHVEELGENEAAKKVLKDLAAGGASDTNAPSPSTTDVLVDLLGEEVDEIGESELLREGLKELGRKWFGD